MNEYPHDFESQNQTPLLLKYIYRDCYFSREIEYKPDDNYCFENWKNYRKATGKMWRLRLPDNSGFLKYYENSDVRYFYRYDFLVIGNDKPIVTHFSSGTYSADIDNGWCTYRLSDNYEMENPQPQISRIPAVLREYERCRGEWETRIVVSR